MDPDDSKTITHNKRNVPNVGHVLLTLWVRCAIQIHYGYNWFVLGRRYNFLLYFGTILYILFLIKEVFK